MYRVGWLMEQQVVEQVWNLAGLSSVELLVGAALVLAVLGLVVKYLIRGAVVALVVVAGMWFLDIPDGTRELAGLYKDAASTAIERLVP